MYDQFNEIVAFSPFGGTLIREDVKGTVLKRVEMENVLEVRDGGDRDMFVYVPASGCPDAKQCQVLMILRDDAEEETARAAMETYELRQLAEDRHFILVFPNPPSEGWHTSGSGLDEDMDYLSRCFMTLPAGKGKVGGFIGMIFYAALTSNTSALLMSMSAKRPTNMAGILLAGQFPEGYEIPEGVNAPQVAYLCGRNPAAEEYLARVNQTGDGVEIAVATEYVSTVNPSVRHMVSAEALSAKEIAHAWAYLFSETRRWTNDTYGTYQERVPFAERGFVAHVKDSSLGVNNGFPHTWYEYVPPQLRGSKKKAPLVFYFHGIGCVPLYGVEQSGWHDIADQDGFIVAYPKPAVNKMWNIWDDPVLPSDHAFVLALIEHMKRTYAIDETRIYVTGFSMGGMMTHAMASAYPELFAAAAPCNGFHWGYLTSLADQAGHLPGNPRVPDGPLSSLPHTKVFTDKKKAAYDYRMPVFQNTGLLDGKWPITREHDPMCVLDTLTFWKRYNNISNTVPKNGADCESGLTADETFYDCEDQRFLHHRWFSKDEGKPALLEMVLAKRMPHALDLRQIELAWQFIKHFSRASDGSLHYSERSGHSPTRPEKN